MHPFSRVARQRMQTKGTQLWAEDLTDVRKARTDDWQG